MTFKEHFNLIQEGIMHIPRSVWQDILDYYVQVYKEYRTGNKRVALDRQKEFKIDFSGSRFEFLNDLSPTPSLIISFLDGHNPSYFTRLKAERVGGDSIIEQNKAMIALNLDKDFVRITHSTIEHEMAHFIQALIQKKRTMEYVRNKLRKVLKREPSEDSVMYDIFKNPEYIEMIGGLPSKKLLPSYLTPTGKISTGGGEYEGEQIEHAHRPEEYYPRLITALRQMEKAYLRQIKDRPELKNDSQAKREFFNKVYDSIKRGKDEYITPEKSIIHLDRITKFKELGQGLYNKILNNLYNAFVNKETLLNPEDLEKKQQEINLAIQKSKKSGK